MSRERLQMWSRHAGYAARTAAGGGRTITVLMASMDIMAHGAIMATGAGGAGNRFIWKAPAQTGAFFLISMVGRFDDSPHSSPL